MTSVKSIIVFLVCLLFSAELFCQKPSLVLLNLHNRKIKRLKEGYRVKIITFHHGSKVKYKGILNIRNDSCISIDSGALINLDSIYKLGNLPPGKQIFGHVLAASSIGIVIIGVSVWNQVQYLDYFMGFLAALTGASIISTSPYFILIGEHIAHGSMKKVRKRQKLKISYKEKGRS